MTGPLDAGRDLAGHVVVAGVGMTRPVGVQGSHLPPGVDLFSRRSAVRTPRHARLVEIRIERVDRRSAPLTPLVDTHPFCPLPYSTSSREGARLGCPPSRGTNHPVPASARVYASSSHDDAYRPDISRTAEDRCPGTSGRRALEESGPSVSASGGAALYHHRGDARWTRAPRRPEARPALRAVPRHSSTSNRSPST